MTMTSYELSEKKECSFVILRYLPRDSWMRQKANTSDFPEEKPGICSIFSVKST